MKNWKTTVTGILAGLGISLGQLGPIMSGHGGPVNWPTLIGGVLVALLGVLAKDAEKIPMTTPLGTNVDYPLTMSAKTQQQTERAAASKVK